ncbi:class I SAM-dependent methyltransferase [Desulfurococcaceae archaeon MEX13E-LK6-19]|nr:class I SAM-dependent methyltransferase [Desulfurococcaceae archaeon MEX13E-LK6-19]
MAIVPYIPSPMKVVKEALYTVSIGENDVLYDLGAGDGRVVIEAAKQGAYAIAVEIDPYLCEVIRKKALEEGVADRVSVIEASFFDIDLSNATVVYVYLYKSINDILKEKFEKELPIGTRIITIDFPIPSWVPLAVRHTLDEKGIPRTIHIYIKGISNPLARTKKTLVIDYKFIARKIKCIRSL